MSHADGGRRITALAAGGSVLLLSATAVALWPRTYGTAATLVLDGGSHVGNPVALAGRIEAALLERDELATVAMDLPPELRSPDPIGRLRAGIRVQSRGALGFTVEFRGSDPQSVQRIANHLAERAVKLVPKLAASPADNAPALALAERSRAVTEFLTAHPEITIEQSAGKPNSASDSGMDALRNEKRQIEQRLASIGASDNPYADLGQDPEQLNRRLTELKTTIARRETALKQPRAASPPSAVSELTTQWRALLADLATAQASASAAPPPPVISGHVTARATLPTVPLTPNRLVLSIVAALLTMAAAMVAYVLPRRPEPAKRQTPRSGPPSARSNPPPQQPQANDGAAGRDDRPMAATAQRSEPPLPRSDPPPPRNPGSEPPPGRPISEPPGPIAVQRTVVLSGNSGAPPHVTAKRSQTSPGGMEAPSAEAIALAETATGVPQNTTAPPAAPLFGSRPPPGAGSYSVSSSHPPPMGPVTGTTRSSVERLSPLQSARPPSNVGPAPSRRSMSPAADPNAPVIMSRPPALDPEAETWAARFETTPPPAPPEAAPAPAPVEEVPRKRSGRWKTQVMGSMVPLEVTAAREERPPPSEVPDSFQPHPGMLPEIVPVPAPAPAPAPAPTAPLAVANLPEPMAHHDVPGWRPQLDPEALGVTPLRDAVLKQISARRLSIAVTGSPGDGRSQVAAALAFALAQSGARVLVVEADFDRPALHQALAVNAPPGAGFSQQLRGHRNDGQQPKPWAVLRCAANLHALVEGRMRSPGLLTSGLLEGAIQELRGHHHVVILHAPPLNKPSELRPLGSLAQAVVVANLGQAPGVQFGDGALDALL